MNQLKQLCFMMNKSREQNPEFDERHGFQMWVRMRDTPYTRGEIAFGGWNSKDDQDHGKHAFKGEDEESDDEDDDAGMEDCEWCGYTHHYEDKCPNEATQHHYDKWRAEKSGNE